MHLTETHQIDRNNEYFRDMCHFTHLSKNLYNAALYEIRQNFFKNKTYKKYSEVAGEFAKGNPDFKALPAKVAQQTLRLVDQNFKSFFGLRRKKLPANLPQYLDKSGHMTLIYTNQAISYKDTGYIKLSGTDIKIKTNRDNIQQVRVTPHGGYFSVEIVYSVSTAEMKTEGNLAAIDLGLNNLATVVTDVSKPVIFNGRPVKSINHFYNRAMARQKSIQERRNQQGTTHKTRHLSRKRKNKISDYLHKTTTKIINHLVSNDICHLFIGENKGWKQEISLGKRNNQNFVQVPFNKLKQMLQYKAIRHGINVHFREESYTSKASFLSNDPIPTHGEPHDHKFSGHRVKRGLYKDKYHGTINADVNGAYNILRKAAGDFHFHPVQARSRPAVITVKFN